MSTVPIGERLAAGRASEIFASPPGHVVKLYHQAVPRPVARREFDNMVSACALGLPVARPVLLFEHDGRQGIRMRGASGRTLLSLVEAGAVVSDAARALASAHLAVHACDGALFTSLRERVLRVLAPREGADDPLINGARELATLLPDGGALCHGDLHPGNVLFDIHSMTILDWLDAARGPREADIARTLVVVDHGRPGVVDEAVRRQTRETYLAHYRAHAATPPDDDAVEAWYTVMLAARLAEPVDAHETRQLLAALRRCLESRDGG